MNPKKPRAKTCINPACGEKFTPRVGSVGQKVCSPACAYAMKDVNQERAQKAIKAVERESHKEAKAKIKTRGQHAKEAQAAVNAWIRERDKALPCISCGTMADVQYAAGHFKSVGSTPALRFEPLNIHKQCNRNCNMAKSGNITEYRIGLIKRVGQEVVDWLEGPHEPKKYTIEELIKIKEKYRLMLRELTRNI